MDPLASPPSSPCCGLCQLDEARAYCLGCARHIDEISRWPTMPDAEKQAIINTLPQRRSAAAPKR